MGGIIILKILELVILLIVFYIVFRTYFSRQKINKVLKIFLFVIAGIFILIGIFTFLMITSGFNTGLIFNPYLGNFLIVLLSISPILTGILLLISIQDKVKRNNKK